MKVAKGDYKSKTTIECVTNSNKNHVLTGARLLQWPHLYIRQVHNPLDSLSKDNRLMAQKIMVKYLTKPSNIPWGIELNKDIFGFIKDNWVKGLWGEHHNTWRNGCQLYICAWKIQNPTNLDID